MSGWSTLTQLRAFCKANGREGELNQARGEGELKGLTGKELWQFVLNQMQLNGGADVAAVRSPIGFMPHEDERLARLADESMGRKAKPEEVVDWIYDNMGVTVAKIVSDTIPCSGAVALLRWARSEVGNQRDFYISMWAKRIANKQQTDGTGLLSDDSRSTERAIDAFEQAMGGG